MEQPDYTNIVRIVELADHAEVNAHLDSGWRLLSVRTEPVTAGQQRTVYVLGLPRAENQAASPASVGETAAAQHLRSPPAFSTTPRSSRAQSDHAPFAGPVSEPREQETRRSQAKTGRPSTAAPSRDDVPTLKEAPPAPLVWRLPLQEVSPKKTRRRKDQEQPTPPREPSDDELRHQAAWQQVRETGKPVLFDGKWLMPEGISPWEAIERLPDGVREQTRAAMQEQVAHAFLGAVEQTRTEIREKLTERGELERYEALPYAAQMALAESILRQQWGLPELPVRELLKRHEARLEGEPEDDTRPKRSRRRSR